MQPGWCQPVRHEFMENECEALPGVAYPGVRDNRSTVDTKTGYDDDDDDEIRLLSFLAISELIMGYIDICWMTSPVHILSCYFTVLDYS